MNLFSDEDFNSSYQVSQFKDEFPARILSCCVCKGVPKHPKTTPCHHIFCSVCLEKFMRIGQSCPECSASLLEDEVSDLSGYVMSIYNSLQLKCANCNEQCSIEYMANHDRQCLSARKQKSKTPLSSTSIKYMKYRRLKDVISTVGKDVEKVCLEHLEDETDVYFGLLVAHLHTKKDDRLEKVVQAWRGDSGDVETSLSADLCLALRVDSIQSKTQYAKQHEMMKNLAVNPFVSLYELNQAEKKYLPGTVRYGIEGDDPQSSKYHTPAKPHLDKHSTEPIDLMNDFTDVCPDTFTPNVCGVRWFYDDCIAKTLEELDDTIESNMKSMGLTHSSSLLYKVFIKDGCDGMGDVSVYRGIGDRVLPDKAFRTSFCILKVQVTIDDTQHTVFEEEYPNSVRTNRPLVEAVGDENDSPSALICILPIEYERKFSTGKIYAVQCRSGMKRFEIDFYTSMIDEKLDRAESGLQGSGSSFICTLCHATRDSARTNLGEFKIDRTYQGTYEMAEYIQKNPDKLSKNEMDAIAKGVKSTPILFMDAIKKGVDATHADINIGRFFKNLLCREIAQVTSWTLTADIKDLVIHAEKAFDRHLKRTVGLNAELMMPGNYARVIFDSKNFDVVVHLVPNARRKADVKSLLEMFSELRQVYRANRPLIECPDLVQTYKATAISLGKALLTEFDYVQWPNYLHKIIEHVQELIQRPDGPGTVGGMSGEGNEAGNKVFRHFRRNLSRRGATYDSLRDILVLHWLYSSPRLRHLASVEKQKKSCSLCKELGHNIRTCAKRSTGDEDP